MQPQVSINYVTSDYSIFKRLTGNRPLNPRKVERMVNKIRNRNLLNVFPLVVDRDMFVFDGQYRLEAAKILCLPVTYTVATDIERQDVIDVNGDPNPWRLEDFLASHMELGNEEYEHLNSFVNEYGGTDGIHLSDAIGLCHYPNGDGPAKLTKKFKDGKYIANNMGFANRVATALVKDFKPRLPKHYCQRVFVHAVTHLFNDARYDHERMQQKLEHVGGRLQPRVSKKEYFPLLNDIYNWKVRADEVVEFTLRKPSRHPQVAE